jgi:protocatechuate 3,4-dioxygenase beta subunit
VPVKRSAAKRTVWWVTACAAAYSFVLSACTSSTAPVSTPGIAPGTIVCKGLYSEPERSDSYLPGAQEVLADGDELAIEVTVYAPVSGGCAPATGVMLEIWHTGPDGYSPDKWRTALITDDAGTVVYTTRWPRQDVEFPHLHMSANWMGANYSWTVAAYENESGIMELNLILVRPAEEPSLIPEV